MVTQPGDPLPPEPSEEGEESAKKPGAKGGKKPGGKGGGLSRPGLKMPNPKVGKMPGAKSKKKKKKKKSKKGKKSKGKKKKKKKGKKGPKAANLDEPEYDDDNDEDYSEDEDYSGLYNDGPFELGIHLKPSKPLRRRVVPPIRLRSGVPPLLGLGMPGRLPPLPLPLRKRVPLDFMNLAHVSYDEDDDNNDYDEDYHHKDKKRKSFKKVYRPKVKKRIPRITRRARKPYKRISPLQIGPRSGEYISPMQIGPR